MKKQFLLLTGFLGLAAVAFGGGIVTNTNQSAAWVRTLVRDASTDADAVYFNPAGLVKLNDGFHFSLNSQTIFQNKDVTSSYVNLDPTPKKYEGKVKAPVFPGFYATWKKNKLAVSFGFNPIGGGGGADYDKGLPSFEEDYSDLVPILGAQLAQIDAVLGNDPPFGYGFDPNFRNITAYKAQIEFKGTSVYFGYQLGLSYKLNDVFSVFAGARYVSAKNTYKGQITNVLISASPNDPLAPGLYDVPAKDYVPGDYLRAISDAAGIKNTSIDTLLDNTAAYLDGVTADRAVNVEEKGNGVAPILGLNISLGDKLNIGLKYEFKTKLNVKQAIIDLKDGDLPNLFKEDSTVHSDMPAMASLGVSYKILPQLKANAGFHYYFDKSASYGKTLDATGELVDNDKVIDKNYFEVAGGLEYNITEGLVISAGYLLAKTGVSADYQSDMSFSLTSSTVGGGLGYRFNENLMVNLGAAYTAYQDGTKERMHPIHGLGMSVPVTDTYYKNNFFFGIGVDVSF